jgi:metal-responsive CopG/Arc/MetJ family transcriptional regulator
VEKVVSLSVRVPATLNRLIERKADRDGVPKSEVIRIALMRYLVEEQSAVDGATEGADMQAQNTTETEAPPKKGAR